MTTIITSKATERKLRVGEALNHLITTVCSAYKDYWSRPTEELLEDLNVNIPETLELFVGNTSLNTAINAAQDALNILDERGNPVYPLRAPVEPGRVDITFNGNNFVQVVPEIE